MNTRKFPRTTAEAFKGVDYSCAVERPARRMPIPWLAMAVVAVLSLIVARV